MKKYISLYLITILSIISILLTTKSVLANEQSREAVFPSATEEVEQVRMLNADGSYGGNLNKELYGNGAPLNGANDYKTETSYYGSIDYYNAKSNDTLTILENFETYQQTCEGTGGIACVMMAVNRLNKTELESEEDFMSIYTNVTGEEIDKTSQQSAQGLATLAKNCGLSAKTNAFRTSGYSNNISGMLTYFVDCIEQGKVVLVGYQRDIRYRWFCVVGVDSMDGVYGDEDALILADPFDALDHNQDGFFMVQAQRFYRWWFKAANSSSTPKSRQYECIEISDGKSHEFTREQGRYTASQIVPENHILTNTDGTYGGNANQTSFAGYTPVYSTWEQRLDSSYSKKYGDGTVYNGAYDRLDSPYFIFHDIYNGAEALECGVNLLLLKNYRIPQQSTSSGCGICSTVGVCYYYGYDVSCPNGFHELRLYDEYEKKYSTTIYNVGTSVSRLSGILKSIVGLTKVTYSTTSAGSSLSFPTYTSFKEFVQEHLSADRPIVVSWKPRGGHYETIIGFDDMGTSTVYDDVIILANSSDWIDHYQDGYNIYPAVNFYGNWYNGSLTVNQSYYVPYRNE